MFVFGDFKKNVRLWPKKEVSTDNLIFQLHYRMTFIFILVCMVIVSSRQFIREHINCLSDRAVGPVINTFCFFSSTFTVAKYHNESYVIGTHVLQPGVGPATPEDGLKYHAYYQWVPFVLFGQAMLFYFPHMLWKGLENGRLSALVNSAKSLPMSSEKDVTINGMKLDSEDTKLKRSKRLKEVYLTSLRFKVNSDWAKSLVMCETLNACNIVLQIFAVDAFLKGQFKDLGSRWMDGEDILETVFPKMTKCLFHSYGPTGTIQNHDALCVMALNIINEKIYIILWFWFMFLLIVTVAGLVWRFLTFLLHRRSGAFNRLVWGQRSPGPAIKRKEMEVIATKLSFSDWLFLYYLGKNMEGGMFRKTVADLATALTTPTINLRESEKSNLANESYC